MKLHKLSLLCIFAMSAVAFAQTGLRETNNTPGTVPRLGGNVLLDHGDAAIGRTTGGLVSTKLTGLPDGQDSTVTADDFDVTADRIWLIDAITTTGFTNLPNDPDAFGIVIYEDSTTTPGTPGDQVFEWEGVPSNGIDDTLQEIQFGSPIVLTGGRYWISTYGIYNGVSDLGDGRWNWGSGPTTIDNDLHLADFADLFGICCDWTSATDLGVGDRSTSFVIMGTETDCVDPELVGINGQPGQNGEIVIQGSPGCTYTVTITESDGTVSQFDVAIPDCGSGICEGTLNIIIPADATIGVGQQGQSPTGGTIGTVPTLGEWGLIAFVTLLMGGALIMMRKRRLA